MTLMENPSVFAKWDNFPAEMRAHRGRSISLLYYVSIEDRITVGHPQRCLRKQADQALDGSER